MWVIPYNPYLLLSFKAHLNCEIVACVKAIAYVHKYLFKNGVMTDFRVSGNNGDNNAPIDECQDFIDSSYMTPCAAFDKIIESKLYYQHPPIKRLSVHEPNLHTLNFRADATAEEIDEASADSTSLLLEFFKVCSDIRNGKYDNHPKINELRQLRYIEVPEFFSWTKNTWKIRTTKSFQIGRIYTVHLSKKELYYIRLLLSHVVLPTSFEFLLGGARTFYEAAVNRRIAVDDTQWISCINDAFLAGQLGMRFIRTFATVLLNGEVLDVPELVMRFKIQLFVCATAEAIHKYRLDLLDFDFSTKCFHLALFHLNNLTEGKFRDSLPDFNSLIDWNDFELTDNPLINYQRDYDSNEELEAFHNKYETLNPDQKVLCDALIEAVNQGDEDCLHDRLFFINASGGTGKTYVYNTIVNYVRGNNKVAITVASSGIASTLFSKGATSHSVFKLPFAPDSSSVCNVKKNTQLASLLLAADIFIWDEVSMSSKYLIEAVDRLLQDLTGVKRPFGGKLIVLGGDFKQTLPIVKNDVASSISQSFFESFLFEKFSHFSLTINQRLLNDNSGYAKWVLDVGLGRTGEKLAQSASKYCLDPFSGNENNNFSIPIFDRSEALINAVFGDHFPDDLDSLGALFTDSMIITCTNANVDVLNQTIIESYFKPGLSETLCSTLSATNALVADADGSLSSHFPPDVLASLIVEGFPESTIKLKPGMPIMLTRNIDVKNGLCNGTRLLFLEKDRSLLRCKIITPGFHYNEVVLIHRIIFLHEPDEQIPVAFKRIQYPIRPCFCITVNKS